MNKYILIVGAVLLDVTGLAQRGQEDSEDKIGSVSLRVGGVAFNVAINLRELGHEVQLFTCLRSASPISRIIKDSLRSSGIGIKYIIERDNVPEAVFVSLKETGMQDGPDLDFGVLTSSPIEDVPISTADGIASAIAEASMIIADTNLSARQLARLRQMCHAANRKLYIVSASDAKSQRIVEASSPSERFGMVSMNAREAEKIGLLSISEDDLSLPTNKIDADIIMISRGEKGAFLFRGGTKWDTVPAPDMKGRKIYPTGAGDALFSAVCSCLANGREPTDAEECEKIVDSIGQVLRSDTPNLNNVIPRINDPNTSNLAFGITCCIVCVAGLFVGLSPLGFSALWIHIPLSLILAGAFGGVGAWLQPLWRQLRHTGEEEFPSSNFTIWVGVVIGFISTVVGTLPNMVELLEGAKPSPSAMTWHIILSMVVGCVSGLSLSEAGRKIIRGSASE